MNRSSTAEQRMHVLRTIATLGGLSDEECQRNTGLDGNSQRPRRIECVERGWVRDSGYKRKTMAGWKAIVWKVTMEGRAALKAHKP